MDKTVIKHFSKVASEELHQQIAEEGFEISIRFNPNPAQEYMGRPMNWEVTLTQNDVLVQSLSFVYLTYAAEQVEEFALFALDAIKQPKKADDDDRNNYYIIVDWAENGHFGASLWRCKCEHFNHPLEDKRVTSYEGTAKEIAVSINRFVTGPVDVKQPDGTFIEAYNASGVERELLKFGDK